MSLQGFLSFEPHNLFLQGIQILYATDNFVMFTSFKIERVSCMRKIQNLTIKTDRTS